MKKKFKYKVNKFLRITLYISLFLFTGVMFTLIIASSTLDFNIPQIETIKIYDNKGEILTTYSNGRRKSYIELSEISNDAINAFLSIEDKRYYKHTGLDFIRICKAALVDIMSKSTKEGASTITQQYARNLFLSHEKSVKRKLSEMLIALNLESKYSKDEILEGYLNSIYFDDGIYGIEDASYYYFNKSAKDLTLKESTILASIPKGPSLYSPINNKVRNEQRSKLILNEMLEDGVISQKEYEVAINEEVKLYGINRFKLDETAPYFQDYIITKLKEIIGIGDKLKTGVKVYTTLDKELNNTVVKSISSRIESDDLQTSIICVKPLTGEILSLVGGKSYKESTYNRAVNSFRQPGSTIKPFLYLSALENGFSVATTFKSEKTTFYINKEAYSPNNFLKIYPNKDVSMTYAIATSDNIYAMKTHLFLGCNKLKEMLQRLGIKKEIEAVPSLALGTISLSNLELSSIYQVLSSGGIKKELYGIDKITSLKNNELLYKHIDKGNILVNESDVYCLNDAMTSVFDDGLTINIRPTGVSIASRLKNRYSAKSGSTDFDNWMVGYNKDIQVIIWTGHDDNSIITKKSDTSCCKWMFADIAESYLKNKTASWYELPNDVISIELNPITGFYSSINEYHKPMYFKRSSIPWYIELLYY